MLTQKQILLGRVRHFDSKIETAKLEREREIKEYLIESGWEVKPIPDDEDNENTVQYWKHGKVSTSIEQAFELEQNGYD